MPLLAYADWLTEHGDIERAEFLRVQCRLAAGRNDQGWMLG
jgi:uncharacterized protein (TIGR02996 family)